MSGKRTRKIKELVFKGDPKLLMAIPSYFGQYVTNKMTDEDQIYKYAKKLYKELSRKGDKKKLKEIFNVGGN